VKQTERNKTLKRGTELFLVGITAQRDEGDRRILLGNNIRYWAVMVWPLRFHCVGILIAAGLPGVYV
jgi:hypothetical protein